MTLEEYKQAVGEGTIDKPTLRDQFAMAALTGLLASEAIYDEPKRAAEAAYLTADAMMKAREKKGEI